MGGVCNTRLSVTYFTHTQISHDLRDTGDPTVAKILESIQRAVNGDRQPSTSARAAGNEGVSHLRGHQPSGDWEGDDSDVDSDDEDNLIDIGEDEVEKADAEIGKNEGEDVVKASEEIHELISVCGLNQLGADLTNLEHSIHMEGNLINLDESFSLPTISMTSFTRKLRDHGGTLMFPSPAMPTHK